MLKNCTFLNTLRLFLCLKKVKSCLFPPVMTSKKLHTHRYRYYRGHAFLDKKNK